MADVEVAPLALVLDSLFEDLALEQAAAAERGWELRRWDGRQHDLASAEIALHVATRVDAALIAAMPRCRVIVRFGTGLDTVDIPFAGSRGIRVVNVRDYGIPEMTAHTLGLAFALERRLLETAGHGISPDTPWQAFADSWPLAGRTASTVVGFGSIGRSVARALRAVGHEVWVVSRHGAAEAPAEGLPVVDLERGLAHADMLFLHCALDATTAGMIGAPEVERLPRGALIVNTARAALMDEAVVAEALKRGHLAGLALDGRLTPDSPLRQLAGDPRVLLTPHVGWYSERSAGILRRRAVERAIEAAGQP